MTGERQNAVIADAMGCWDAERSELYGSCLIDYTDRDDLEEAKAVLLPTLSGKLRYRYWLNRVVKPTDSAELLFARPDQAREALVRTIGKWEGE